MDVGDAIRRRRSVRRFDRDRPVPRELLLEILDAGRWAPSSCNLQTWDYVVVEDDDLRRRLAAETKSVSIAPVAVFVVYDRELAREGLANVQSASASIMTMLLKATSLGLASLWVNALGDRDRVRALLGVPDDLEVLALVCLGFPKDDPPPPPERRALNEVVHWDRYSGGGGLPKSPDPNDWTLDEIGLYFKRKLQSGTRYNKPIVSFFEPVMRAVVESLGELGGDQALLDVLPGTGIYTEALHEHYGAVDLAVMESSAENHFFAARRSGGRVGFVPFPRERLEQILDACAPAGATVRLARESGGLPVMPRVLPRPELAPGPFDAATILFRLEGIPRVERTRLLADVFDRLRPGGRLVVAYTSRRSWHRPAYALRRRLGRNSVEYAPVPEPNIIGPYEALAPGEVERALIGAGFRRESEIRLFPLPDLEIIGPKLERAGGVIRLMGRCLTFGTALLKPVEALLKPFARIRIECLTRP